MKRLFQLLITLAVATAATAATVNRQQARQQAAQFLQQHGVQLGTEPTTVRGRHTQAADQPLYVFNTADSRGFVVVSGDDRTDAILGYTQQGSYDDDNVPPALQEWLAQMTAEIEALQQPAEARAASAAPKAVSPQVSSHPAILPLIQTTWNQGNSSSNSQNTDGIYNIRLPQIGESYPCTGCVATAGAQIMYYYKWPQEATLEVPGYPSDLAATSNSLPAKQFEWDKMKTSYNSSDANSVAAYAVADLMLYAGWAANMNYGVGGSGASQSTLARNMVNYFGYDPYWKRVNRDSYLVADWDELIYNELANGRPVIYDGNSDSGGHAFICDGYDGEGLYHFNWGWGGHQNGYFKLQATNPDGAYNSPGYIFGNSAIIGLQPETGIVPIDPNDDDEWEVETIEGVVANAYGCTLDSTTVSTYLHNPNDGSYGFGLGLAELNGDGTLNVIDKSYEYYKNYSLPRGGVYSGFSFNLAELDLPEGTHRIVPVSLLNDEDEWKRCHPADLWFEVNVDGDNMTAVQHPVDKVLINSFEMVSNGIPGYGQDVQVRVTNQGDNIEKVFYLYIDEDRHSMKTLKIANGNTKEFRLSTRELTEGTHTLTLRDGYNTLATKEVNIKIDLEATAFNVGGDLKFAGTTLPVDVTVENHAGDFTLPLYLFASQTSTKGYPAYIAGTAIPSGGSEDVRFYFTPDAAGKWNFWVSTDQSGSDVIGQGFVDIDAAPSGKVTLEMVGEGTVTCKPGGVALFEMTVKNTGSTTFYRNFMSHLWTPLGGGRYSWSSANDAYTDNVVIEPGEEVTVTLTFTNLEEEITYYIDPSYPDTYSGNYWVALNEHWWDIVYTAPTDIEPDPEPEPDPIPGDTDGYGKLTAEDVTPLIDYLTGKLTEVPANADVNGDGKVDITDITKIIEDILNADRQ